MGKVMRPTLPALVALLVATATVAAGAPVPLPADADAGPATGTDTAGQQPSTAPIDTVQNSSDYLSLSGQTRSSAEFGNATLDVAGTVAMDNGRLRTSFNETATLQAFRSADNSTARTAIVERTANRIDNRTAALQDRQQRAVSAYNRGELSAEAFLQRLAVIDAEAQRFDTYIGTVLRTTSRTPGYSLPNSLRTRLESLRVEPIILQGPVRTNVRRSVSGEDDAFGVYIETTNDGIILARLAGNRYVREALLADEYQQPGPDQFKQGEQAPISTAYERAQTLYPWTFENAITTPSATGYGSTPIYQISVDHTQGQLVSYIDGTTTNVFRETQEKRLSRLPLTGNATNSTDALGVRARLSHESGPMNVSVVDETGEPVDARVTLNGQFVGQTGSDGALWAIQPHGPVTLNATTSAGERVTLQLDGN